MITQERLKHLLKYDSDTGLFTWINKSSHKSNVELGTVAGSMEPQGYIRIKIDGNKYRAHHLVFLYLYGAMPSDQVDHLNRIRWDNRRFNLREATATINHRNMPKLSNNRSGVNGVCWDMRCKKWMSYIGISGKSVVLGRFSNFNDAVIERKMAEFLHGYHPSHGSAPNNGAA